MKKTILTVFAVIAVSLAAQAQSFTLGVKGGISSSKMDVNEVRNNPRVYTEEENITGYHAGLFSRFQVLGFNLQPEALLVSSGGKFTYDQNGSTLEEKFRLTRLDVPVLVGYSFLNLIRVQAGPVASIMLKARQDGKNIDDYLDETDWGFQAGVGLDISSLTFDVRYERIKREYTNTANNSSMDMNNQQVIFSLGYKFIK